MLSVKVRVLVLIAVCVCVALLCPTATKSEEKRPSVSELLSRLEAAQKPFNRQASTVEHLFNGKESSPGSNGRSWRGKVIVEHRQNPEGLFDEKSSTWANLQKGTDTIQTPEEGEQKRSLWDGKLLYYYAGGKTWIVEIRRGKVSRIKTEKR